MKKSIINGIIVCLLCFFTSCLSIMEGKRKPMVLVDGPQDLKVKNLTTGQELPIVYVDAGGKSSATTKTNTFYRAPGVLFRAKKGTRLELKYGDNATILTTGTKPYTGWLILEGCFSFGLFALIDILNGAGYSHTPRYVDVPALFNNQTPRTEEELQYYIMSHSRRVD